MIFSIKKGHHYSNGFLYKLINLLNTSKTAYFYVTFNESVIYEDKTPDRFDVNKLFGFSSGFHHKDSNRFGWNCLDGQIHIYAYSYVNGVRIIDEICVVDINRKYRFLIETKFSNVIFTVIDDKNNLKEVTQIISGKKIFGYNLWPYFGGNKTAPKNMHIELNQF